MPGPLWNDQVDAAWAAMQRAEATSRHIPPAAELPDLYSAADAARALGVQPTEVSKRADRHGVGTRTVGGGTRIFTEADLPALATPTGKVGNPNFGAVKAACAVSQSPAAGEAERQ